MSLFVTNFHEKKPYLADQNIFQGVALRSAFLDSKLLFCLNLTILVSWMNEFLFITYFSIKMAFLPNVITIQFTNDFKNRCSSVSLSKHNSKNHWFSGSTIYFLTTLTFQLLLVFNLFVNILRNPMVDLLVSIYSSLFWE